MVQYSEACFWDCNIANLLSQNSTGTAVGRRGNVEGSTFENPGRPLSDQKRLVDSNSGNHGAVRGIEVLRRLWRLTYTV